MNLGRTCNLLVIVGCVIGFASSPLNIPSMVMVLIFLMALIAGLLSMFGLGRPDKENYKPPVLAVFVSGALLAVTGIAMISAMMNPPAPIDIPPSTEPIVNEQWQFRLNHPGDGWTVLTNEQIAQVNPSATAGASHESGVVAFVFASRFEGTLDGKEEEVGRPVLDQHVAAMRDRGAEVNVVSAGPTTLHETSAFGYQITFENEGHTHRAHSMILALGGRQFRIVATGKAGTLDEEGSMFGAFLKALEFLPPARDGNANEQPTGN